MRARLALGTILAVVVAGLSAGIVLALDGFASTSGGATRPARTLTLRCAEDFLCLDRRYRDLVRSSGVEAAFIDLKVEYRRSQFVRVACHQLAHTIGRAAAEHSSTVAGPFARGDSFCASGYYHGVVQAVAARVGSKAIVARIESACAGLPANDRHAHVNCVHGLGHGVMTALANDLRASLSACDRLATPDDRSLCDGGVFMENVAAGMGLAHAGTRYLRAGRPLYPCTAVADRYKQACYRRQGMYILRTVDNDFPSAFALCASVRAPFDRTCYESLGTGAAETSVSDSITDTGQTIDAAQLCQLGPDDVARASCVVGAVRTFSVIGGSSLARRFCDTIDARLRRPCLGAGERTRRELGLSRD